MKPHVLLFLVYLTLGYSNLVTTQCPQADEGFVQGRATVNCNCTTGTMQSPIRLLSTTSMPGVERRPLELQNYQLDPRQVNLLNDGHTVVYSFEYPGNEKFTIQGGPLPDRIVFQFESLHFHWGANSARGAEHNVDRRNHSMEMHLVFFNQNISDNFEDARTQPDGLAVLGIFLQMTNRTPEPDYGWIPALERVQDYEATTQLEDPTDFNIKKLIGQQRKPYFYYKGSLTTEPCCESVNWLVQRTPLPISERQLNFFRALRDDKGNPLVDNYRLLQNNPNPVTLYGAGRQIGQQFGFPV